MSGYVGERARRKKRNLLILILLILLILLIFYFKPSSNLKEIVPTNSLLPSESEIQTPEFKTTIEELELKIFDKEQKIIFRNKQIEKLKKEIIVLSEENKNLQKNYISTKEQLTSFSIENKDFEKVNQEKDKIKKDFEKDIKIMNATIVQITKDNNALIKEKNNLKQRIDYDNSQNNKFTQEYNDLKNKNLALIKLKKSLENKITELKDLIEEQNLIIKVLEDTSHHN
tara:strand:- start:345 stop:1028 length:684 start_codon:yes stop_codon:yes gene_type:complete